MGRPVRRDDRRGLAGECERKLGRVRDCRRREEKLRPAPVHQREPPQSSQDVGDLRSEDTPIDVCLVDDDVAQVREKVAPAIVMR